MAISRLISQLPISRKLIGAMLLISFLSAIFILFDWCPSCENPTLLAVPSLKYLPIAGIMLSGSLMTLWWFGIKHEANSQTESAKKYGLLYGQLHHLPCS